MRNKVNLEFDQSINIATGTSAGSRLWKNTKWLWSELVDKFLKEYKTNETYKEFIGSSKTEQGKMKDVGGYVGGYLRKGRRKPENVANRQLMTLDIDFAHIDFWDDFTMLYDCAAVLHGTHKHCDESPRYRLVIPINREVTPDEYVAISRNVAGTLGIDLFDNTTFQTNRLMFWPSNPKDVEYYAVYQDGPWIDADEVLDSYVDWKDSSAWPTADKNFQEVKNAALKQEDPRKKKGIIGAFCRTYTITESIETFLDDIYVPTTDDRYTYLKGSAASGMIVYDDLFAYSHHGTDPCGNKLCNAYDLVRIHKFGHLDSNDENQKSKRKSEREMEDFARADGPTKRTVVAETIESAKYDFTKDKEDTLELEEETEEDLAWTEKLTIDHKGNYVSSSNNLNEIFTNDKRLKGAFRLNGFDGIRYVFKSLPWRRITKPEPIKNVDFSGVRNYLESVYGIVGSLKIDDSLALEFEKQSFHPVLDYLEELFWDGQKRVDTLLIDYFGAEDNQYTREAVRKTLVAAVARVKRPGIKFDLVLTLVGAQGTGKSTFANKLGQSWFSDTFMTVNGKDAFEQLQGSWIIEMAELAGIKKAEAEAVKHYISKQEDKFRPAYARTSETFPRQCIFIATTNNRDFLRDPSGNRRFMPIDIKHSKDYLSIWDIDQDTIDQIWAEAVEIYEIGEKLFLSDGAEAIAVVEQKGHSESDERTGIIEKYLNTFVPVTWDTMNVYERRNFFMDDEIKPIGTEPREFVCIAEIWCECLGKEKEDMDKYKTREINDIMRGLDDWEQSTSGRKFEIYGKQRYYRRVLDEI